jgi:hypothetical protein
MLHRASRSHFSGIKTLYVIQASSISNLKSSGHKTFFSIPSFSIPTGKMQSLQEVIKFNNEGARLLQSGSTMDALYVFRMAAVSLKQVRLAIPSTEHAPSTPDTTPCVAPTLQIPSKGDCDMILEEKVCQSVQSPHDGAFYVHYRPLIIPENMLLSSEDPCELVQILTTFVLFNLALACHHYGKVSGTIEPLERAKELYRVVLRSQGCGDEGALQAVDLMQCLALNNLAHLHYEQQQYEISTRYMKGMYEIIGETQCLDDDRYVSSHEAEEILLNVHFALPPSVATAA